MVNFKEEIAKIIGQILDGLTEDEIKDMVEVPQDDKMGDYAFPCFKLAKTLRKACLLYTSDRADRSGNRGRRKSGRISDSGRTENGQR